MIDKTLMVMDTHAASIKAAIAAGVKIAMGTDSGVVPHGQNLRELDLMVGLRDERRPTPSSPRRRRRPSSWASTSELGTLEPGKRADVVLVEGDALDGLAGRVRRVWKDGVQVV